MADDIRTSVEVETAGGVSNLENLSKAAGDADTAIDNIGKTAATVDSAANVSVPVEAPGAAETATALGDVGAAGDSAGIGAHAAFDQLQKLPGPLGDIAGQAGQALDNIGPLAEQMGLSAETAGKLGAGLGIAAVAVGIGAAAWQLYKSQQEKATKAAKDMLAVQEDFAKGNFETAADKLTKSYGALLQQGHDLAGLSVVDMTKFIAGDPAAIDRVTAAINAYIQTLPDSEVGLGIGLTKNLENAAAAWEHNAGGMADVAALKPDVVTALDELARSAGTAGTNVSDLADEFKGLTGALDVQASALDVADAFDGVVKAAETWAATVTTGGQAQEDANRGVERSYITLKEKVIAYAQQVGDLPADKVTKILAEIDNGSLAQAEADFAELTKPRTATITIQQIFGGTPTSPYVAAPKAATPSSSKPSYSVTNIFPPAITPLAVEQAQHRWSQTQGPAPS